MYNHFISIFLKENFLQSSGNDVTEVNDYSSRYYHNYLIMPKLACSAE
jgi:hypothetical protein